jgi:hypothetical protein
VTVYVDELRSYGQKATSGGRYFGSGKESCHLMADTEDELHAFAARLGMKRSWAQKPGTWTVHYDLTPPKRAQAIRLGAVFVPAMDQARARVAQMRAAREEQDGHLEG